MLFAIFSFLIGCASQDNNSNQISVKDARSSQWKNISSDLIPFNPIAGLRDQWMILASGNDSAYNAMTIAWGSWGMLWSKPVVNVYIRTSRHTNHFMQENDYFTVTAFPNDARQSLQYMGSHSGRDEKDKAASAGLTVEFTKLGNPVFKEAILAVECKKVYSSQLEINNLPDYMKAMYNENDSVLHIMYVGEIVNVMTKE